MLPCEPCCIGERLKFGLWPGVILSTLSTSRVVNPGGRGRAGLRASIVWRFSEGVMAMDWEVACECLLPQREG